MSEHPQQHERRTGEQNEHDDENELHPRIWVGCLAAYNNGHLHGDWFPAAVDPLELVAAAQGVIASSPQPDAEEWAIFDYDEFGGYRVEEHDALDHVALVARGIAEHGHAYATWAELHDGEQSMLDQFENAYMGEYESAEAWARELLDELHLEGLNAIPDSLRPYLRIDYQGWARDAELAGDLHFEDAPGGGVYVFAVR